ncbi:pso2 [[Candida] subhashii]|uniref:Pso2 n=1 Tax=[Candida] subhashii TaxID=561895 RepID=A0A8J5QHE7_9ASCO|nr:pso2 [[Candida] subhashii]KAG7662109.1 pso2 [[Candida] subhashii]
MKQRSIFEFTQRKVESTNEIIEIMSENELDNTDTATEESCFSVTIETKLEDISCPICNINIGKLTLSDRTDHVDTCLVRVTFVQEPPKPLLKQENPRPPTQQEELDSNKRRKLEIPKDAEKLKYMNSTPSSTKSDQIKVPKSITPSKGNRKPIPHLKRMSFPINPPTKQQSYQISVDAFSFAPDDNITQYFLTHFHSDHYGGISKKWAYERVFTDDDFDNDSKYTRIIYCTEITGKLLTLYFSIDPRFIKHLKMDTRYLVKSYNGEAVEDGGIESMEGNGPGLYVTPITANHCPGAAIFLFESIGLNGQKYRILHCGDFRVNKEILCHPLLEPFNLQSRSPNEVLKIDKIYLDTTYMSPVYNFPAQELVCETVATMFQDLLLEQQQGESLFSTWFGMLTQSRITDFLRIQQQPTTKKKKKFLILVGTYVIGKEKLAITISKKLDNCPIYVSNINSRKSKLEILKTYQDQYLDQVLTSDDLGDTHPSECVIHLVPMKIVSSIQELSNYFNHNRYYESFERCIGLRPTGWSFVPGGNRGIKQDESLEPKNHLHMVADIMSIRPQFSYLNNILSQSPPVIKSSTKGKPDRQLYRIYALPYSEHSSFRELAYFVVFMKSDIVIPTVNVENSTNARNMDAMIEIWNLVQRIKFGGLKAVDRNIDMEVIEKFENITLDSF